MGGSFLLWQTKRLRDWKTLDLEIAGDGWEISDVRLGDWKTIDLETAGADERHQMSDI